MVSESESEREREWVWSAEGKLAEGEGGSLQKTKISFGNLYPKQQPTF